MTEIITPSNIMFAIGIIGTIFAIYKSYHNPQVDLDKKVAVDQSEVDGKAKLLAQQLQWTIEGNEKRFADVQGSIKEAFLLAQNHTHTVDVKVDKLIELTGEMGKEITRLATIIEERIPRK